MADRNHIIEILQNQQTSNDFGELIDEWVMIKTLYSSYEPIYGNQFFSAEQMQNGTTVKFELEYVGGIKRDMRVKHDNKLYEINSEPINVKGRNITLIIYCKDVVA